MQYFLAYYGVHVVKLFFSVEIKQSCDFDSICKVICTSKFDELF